MSIYEKLSSINVESKIKEKNGLRYLSWSHAWSEVKKYYPNAAYKIIPQVVDEYGNTRPWHDDGKTGWVEVKVTIEDQEATEMLAIMNHKNMAIPAENITSTDANKSIKRCLVKALGLHGLGLYIYEGEDLPEDEKRIIELQDEVDALVKKKIALGDKAKNKVKELCVEAEKKMNPELPDDMLTGNYKSIDNTEVLEELKKKLQTVRK